MDNALEQEIARRLVEQCDESFLEWRTTNVNTPFTLTLEKLHESILAYKREMTEQFWNDLLEEHNHGNMVAFAHEDAIQVLEKSFDLLPEYRPHWLKLSKYMGNIEIIFVQCSCLCHPDAMTPWIRLVKVGCCTCSGKTLA